MAIKTDRQQREERGRRAEAWASCFLRLKGYRILKRRYQNPFGEIDLIAKKCNTLVFCEIKTRSTKDLALEAFGTIQQKRIVRGALAFQAQNPRFSDIDCRFDYLIITGWRCYHLKNAWQS